VKQKNEYEWHAHIIVLNHLLVFIDSEHWRRQALVPGRAGWQGWSYTQELHQYEGPRVSGQASQW